MGQILTLSPTEEDALIALGRYKILNSIQISEVVGCHMKTAERSVKKLRDKGLVNTLNYGVHHGRLPALHYLKNKGMKILQEWGIDRLEKIPTGTFRIKSSAYYHRVGLVDIHIALDKYLEENPDMSLSFYEKDFDFRGANRQGKDATGYREPLTKITYPNGQDFCIPDSAFCLESPTGEKLFFLVEYHRGKDSKRLIEELVERALIIQKGYPTQKYLDQVGQVNPRVLAVCEEPSTNIHVARRLFEDSRLSDRHKGLFAFASMPDLKNGFLGAFNTINGQQFTL